MSSLNIWTPSEGGIEICKNPTEILYRRPRAEIKVIDREQRVVDYIMSDETEDMDLDIIRVTGWMLDYFKRKGPILWSHQRERPAIGRPIGARKANIDGARVLQARVKFAGLDQHYQFAEMIAALVMDGIIRNGSVGFMPEKRKKRERVENESEIVQEYGLTGWEYLKQTLLEYSVCNVGSNLNSGTQERGADEDDNVRRALELARQYIDGSEFDAFAKDLTSEPTVKVRGRPAPEDILKTIDLAAEPTDDDGWLEIGKWDEDAVAEIVTTKSSPEPAQADPGPPVSRDVVPQPPAVSSEAAAPPAAPTADPVEKSGMEADYLAEIRAISDEIAKANEAFSVELAGLKAHFDDALAELFGRVEDEKDHLRAAGKAARIPSDDAPRVPVRRVEDGKPPAKQSTGAVTQAQQVASMTVLIKRIVDEALAAHRGVIA